MKLTREQIDWATSISKSDYPGRLCTIVLRSNMEYAIYLDVDSGEFSLDYDAATFLNGERYYAQAYSRKVKRDYKRSSRSEAIIDGSVESTGGTE